MPDLYPIRVEVAGGKYAVVIHGDGQVSAERHGRPWRERDLVGDNFILSMAQDLMAAREKCDALQNVCEAILIDAENRPVGEGAAELMRHQLRMYVSSLRRVLGIPNPPSE